MDDRIWDVSTFSKNRRRFLEGEIGQQFFAAVVERARADDLLSDEHFTVDGTLIEAWASHKSFKPKSGDDGPDGGTGRNADVDFRGRPRSNETHESTTDPDARLYRKSSTGAAVLGYLGHALMENRNGLIVGVTTTRAKGTGERDAAIELLEALPRSERITVGADKGSYGGLRRATSRDQRYTPQSRSPQCDRPKNDTASRLRNEPTPPKTHRREFRLGEDGRRVAQGSRSWARTRCGCCAVDSLGVQLDPNTQPRSSNMRHLDGSRPMLAGRKTAGSPLPSATPPAKSARHGGPGALSPHFSQAC